MKRRVWPVYKSAHTGDGTEQPERRRRVGGAAVLVQHALLRRLRHRDRQRDGLVELAAARLHRHDGRHGHAVTQHARHDL